MKREMLKSRDGYEIPCLHTLTGDEKKVLIVAHGFGSSKESPTAQMLAGALPEEGIGVIAFDFPAHGDSPVDGAQLSTKHCMDDIAAVEQRARQLAPVAEIGYFGSSFGAYITLLYLGERDHAGKQAFLRSAAVEMPQMFHHKTEEEERQLAEDGFLMLDLDYVRPLKLSKAFFDDLDAHDVFSCYESKTTQLAMVHGNDDETASPLAAEKFAAYAGAELTMIRDGDHRLSQPGMPERVLKLALEFFE